MDYIRSTGKADTNLSQLLLQGRLTNVLSSNGWKHLPLKQSQPKGQNKKPEITAIYRTIKTPRQDNRHKSENDYSCKYTPLYLQGGYEKTAINSNKTLGAKFAMGVPEKSLPPTSCRTAADERHEHGETVSNTLPTSFNDITSIARMRRSEASLVVAYDSEFYYAASDGQSDRLILTWQFAFVRPSAPDKLIQIVCSSYDGSRLLFDKFLSILICHFLTHDDYAALGCTDFRSFDFRSSRRWVYHKNDKYYVTKDLETAYDKSDVPAEKSKFMEYIQFNEFCMEYADWKSHHDPTDRTDLAPKRYGTKPTHATKNAITDTGFEYVDYTKFVDGYVNDFADSNPYALPVTLICHAGKADLTGFAYGFTDVLPRLSDVQGGLVSLSDFYVRPTCFDAYWRYYPIRITIRDTMCFAPAAAKSLAALGAAIGVPKIDVSDADKNNMLAYMLRCPADYLDYSINDSVVTLCYAGALWGYNKQMPVTVSGASVNAAVPVICDYFGLQNAYDSKQARDAYNTNFRGLHSIKKGKLAMPKDKKYAFIENTSLEPINDDARQLMQYAQLAYKGGYNGSSKIGYYDCMTYDYDLENAYPTCMALVPDVDWYGGLRCISGQYLTLDDFHTPFDLLFGYVTFEFPRSVQYPCIPVSVDGCLVFPRTSDGLDGVYASAPELYLALRLGAKVYAKRVFVGVRRRLPDGTVSYSLRAAVKQLVTDRNLSKAAFGKKSVAELLLKTAVCSIYGKTAQDVVEKETWDAFKDSMTNIGGSLLTSPVHSCLTTAGVRCVLLAAQNQLSDLGYDCYSVTTDGFISNAQLSLLDSLDLYGFAALFRLARVALTGDATMWAIKHQQDDLLNITTRGNVSLIVGDAATGKLPGVCAHNSYVSGYDKDSLNDRISFAYAVLTRTGRVSCYNNAWTKFRQLAARKDRQDFAVKPTERKLSMDFDFKRKPVAESFRDVHPAPEQLPDMLYTVANFDTSPYDSVAEYELYKRVAASSNVLRTCADWDAYFIRIHDKQAGYGHIRRQLKDLDWSKLFTVVMGYRLGYWDIPYLNEPLTVQQKVDWINTHNKSKKQFSVNTWKDCRKQTRLAQMLEKSVIEDLLLEMQADTPVKTSDGSPDDSDHATGQTIPVTEQTS